MKTIILSGVARGDKPVGTWLRDIGFALIEAGCEINLSRLDGVAAQEMLANRGMEVVQVVDAYSNSGHGLNRPTPRAGTRAFPEGGSAHREDHLS